ncbi:MAG: ATP-binding protein [Spirochaetes bacterium]|nr:ATP-binding protein [Spirochaetota bacterium]
MKGRFFTRSFAVVSAAILAVAVVALATGTAVTEKVYIQSNAEGLVRAAWAAGSSLPDFWAASSNSDSISSFCSRLAAASGYRVTLVDISGKVLGDSDVNPAVMSNHGDRPEVSGALAGEASWSRRKSSTTGKWMLYAAVPLHGPGEGMVVGVLRLSLSFPGLMQSLGRMKRILFLIALAAVLAALAASAVLIRILSRPIVDLSNRALQYAKGNLGPSSRNERISRENGRFIPQELKILEESLDSMAARLLGKASEAEAMGRRFSAILDSAGEAIVALDSKLGIVEANPAAHKMLNAEPGTLAGNKLSWISGASALAELAQRCLDEGEPVAAEVVLYSGTGATVHVNASPLGGEGNQGIVLAVTDVSVIKRLETMRTDFVSNVSHELRTPIHLIRGFAETLQTSGSFDETSARYLEIIERNAIRMERIVEDLLSLARLEREPAGWLTMESCLMGDIGRSVLETVRDQAAKRTVRLESDLPDALRFQANSGLIEQALINLLENAIRYSPEGSAVLLEANRSGDFIEMRVRDRGSGIPAPDLERIFERFYRADKSHDRKSGGTGLGLAIVRHIAIAHGGSVSAESWSGEGSVFCLRIPVEHTGR